MKKILFIDTDLGGDCDDVGALALANIFQNDGLIEIVGMTHTTSLPWGPACIDIVNRYYHNAHIPIGATTRKNYCVANTNKYAEKMASNFLHAYSERDKVIDSVTLMRKSLTLCDDNSVTIVCVGQLNNASDLLDSKPDHYSNLSGIELVRKKVKEFVIMGGLFKEENEKIYFGNSLYEYEYNIVCDIKSAQNFINKVPVKVVFNDFKVGYQIHTAKSLLDQKDMTHPVTFAYTLFQDCPRESWDLLTVWYGALECDDLFTISKGGTVAIDDNGDTVFKEAEGGNHYYTRLNKPINYVVERIDNVLKGGSYYAKKDNC